MTLKSTDTEFSFKLTESILSAHTSQPSTLNKTNHQYRHPTNNAAKLVTELPLNSVVIHPKDNNSALNEYIGHHFKEDAPVLLDRLSVATPIIAPHYANNDRRKDSTGTLWAYLANDLDSNLRKPVSIKDDNPWHEYDSVFRDSRPPPCYESLRQSPSSLTSFGALLFLFGFVCPPLWWIGSFYPLATETSISEVDKRRSVEMKWMEKWRTLNRLFSLGFSTLLIAAIIILAVLYKNLYT